MAVFSAIAGAISAISSWTISLGALGSFAVGNFLLRGVVQFGLGLISKALSGGSREQGFAIQGKIRAGGVVPRSIALGHTMTAGSLVWHGAWGTSGKTKNAYYTQVIALSDMPVKGLLKVFVNGAAVTLGANSAWGGGKPVLAFRTTKRQAMRDPDGDGVKYVNINTDHMWVRFHNGNQTQADPFLTGVVGPKVAGGYQANRKGRGVAYAVVTTLINQDLFSGFPEFRFVLDGVRLYDVSKDSSAGGNGAQRWNAPQTWGGDGDNLAAVQAYNLLRGIRYNGQWMCGLQGMTAPRLPAAHWINQVNICRAPVKAAGGNEPRYRSAGEVLLDVPLGDTLEKILTAGSGRIAEVGGVYKGYFGAPGAPVATITDGDIVSTAQQSFTPFQGLSDTVNGVSGVYPSPSEGYVERVTRPIYRPDYEAEDGGRRLVVRVPMEFVPFPAQVQRLLWAELRAARRARRHTFTLPSGFYKIEPGDVIEWVSDRHGYASKRFRVDGALDLPNCDLIVDLTEVDPSDHSSWDHDVDYVDPEFEPLEIAPPDLLSADGFSFGAVAVLGASGGAALPGVRILWPSDMAGADAVDVEIYDADFTDVIATARFDNVSLGSGLITSGITARSEYLVRARFVPAPGVSSEWSDLVSLTALAVGAPDPAEITAAGVVVDPSVPAAFVEVMFAHPAPGLVSAFEVRLLGASGVVDTLRTGAPGKVRLRLPDLGFGDYSVDVRAIGFTGDAGDPVSQEIGFSVEDLRPALVSGFKIRVTGDFAQLSWAPGGDLVSHYVIRHLSSGAGDAWQYAMDIEPEFFGTVATVPALSGIYLIKAVSPFGVHSREATVIRANHDALAGFNVVKDVLFGGDLSGALGAGLHRVDGAVRLDSLSGSTDDPVVPEAVLSLDEIVDLGSVMTSRITAVLSALSFDRGFTWSEWGAWSDVDLWVGEVDGKWRIRLQISFTLQDPADPGADWSDWSDFWVGDYHARGFRWRVVFQSFDPDVSVDLNALSVKVDVPDRVISLRDVVCPAAGVRVDFANPFWEAPAVSVTGQDLPLVARLSVTDVSNTGLFVRYLDETGTGVPCSFDLIAKGFGSLGA